MTNKGHKTLLPKSLSILLGVLLLLCPHAKAADQPYIVSAKLSSKILDPQKNEKVFLVVQPSLKSKATVAIYNYLGEKVKTIFSGELKRKSNLKIIWDGLDENGKSVNPGVYYYTVTLLSSKVSSVYNPYSQTQGHLITVTEGGYDEKTNEVFFKLPQAAMVRLRINLAEGGPILATPLDWMPLPAGDYRFPWDGKDASGVIDIKAHPKRNIMIFAYSLADNSIILAGKTKLPDGQFAILNETDMAKKEFPLNLSPDRYLRARKDPRLNRVSKIDIVFPQAKMKDGLPILTDQSPVRVSIDPKDQWVADLSRYELMFYLDTVILFEDESGFTPFTYNFNTKDLTEGEHVLTVNLLTYDDQYATISKKVLITHEKN